MWPKKLFRSKRGIVGVEAAIVLIAFLIIAAALSYVVINMGFYTTQKTKETMQTGLDESLTALQLDGVVTAKTNESSSHILYLLVPVKLSAGRGAVDLGNDSVVVSVYLPNATLMNIYKGAKVTTDTTWDALIQTLGLNDNEAKFAIYNDNGYENTVLESNEKAFLLIRLNSTNADGMLGEYASVKIEVRTAKGAALTVVRTAPGGLNQNCFVDLG
ncbi:MAG: archaellin/type IV pilin N-terminal domain-containing protein [Nitrososphaerota archaeon]|nr:flagellin [Candidatus Bathyarchaeota archaeon]MDW8193578.1 archaellin/type IV pilin N-terminal domain-containing protein [Nitrososphaerota archaeon]